jgi:hypothetical protein
MPHLVEFEQRTLRLFPNIVVSSSTRLALVMCYTFLSRYT